MRPESRSSIAALGLGFAALGALVTHQIAYVTVLGFGVLSHADMTDHGHLAAQWALVTPVAVLAACGFIVRQVQRLGVESPLPVRSLSALTAVMFAIQELTEGLLADRSAWAVATSPAVVLGVLITPLVAWALTRLLGGVTDLVRRFVNTGDAAVGGGRPVSFPRPSSVRLVPLRVSASSPPRGPPARR